jgi:hypothetical protein
MQATRYRDAAVGNREEAEAETAACIAADAEVLEKFMRDISCSKGE